MANRGNRGRGGRGGGRGGRGYPARSGRGKGRGRNPSSSLSPRSRAELEKEKAVARSVDNYREAGKAEVAKRSPASSRPSSSADECDRLRRPSSLPAQRKTGAPVGAAAEAAPKKGSPAASRPSSPALDAVEEERKQLRTNCDRLRRQRDEADVRGQTARDKAATTEWRLEEATQRCQQLEQKLQQQGQVASAQEETNKATQTKLAEVTAELRRSEVASERRRTERDRYQVERDNLRRQQQQQPPPPQQQQQQQQQEEEAAVGGYTLSVPGTIAVLTEKVRAVLEDGRPALALALVEAFKTANTEDDPLGSAQANATWDIVLQGLERRLGGRHIGDFVDAQMAQVRQAEQATAEGGGGE